MRKIVEITQETGIVWRHCPTDKNLADLESRGASIDKMQTGQWLTNKKEWLVQPKLERTQSEAKNTKRKNKRCCTMKKKNLTSGTHFWTETRLREVPRHCKDSTIRSQLTLQET